MSKLTSQLTIALDACIIENFADIFVLELALKRIEKKYDLANPEVIAGLATLADVGAVQSRLIAQPAAALVKGLRAALVQPLRPPAKLLVEALLAGAERGSPPPGKSKLPAFARAARLPPLSGKGDVEAFLLGLMKKERPESAPFTAESLAKLGRALALGWLSHGAEPKHAWAVYAAGYFPDDQTARDLAMMARELGPRVGQFSKAQILVDVLALMNTRLALELLQELATKIKTRSVKERAQRAFDDAAKRAGVSKHDLADKLLRDDAPVGKDFAKRLEQRMVTGAKMPAVELVENILQRDAVRERARGVIFKSGKTTFTIGDDGELLDVSGKRYVLPSTASVTVAHPLDLKATELKKWRAKISKAPFAQLDRVTHAFATTAALAKYAKTIKAVRQGAIYGLEALGWRRGVVIGGVLIGMIRELDGITATIEFEPGIYVGRGMAAVDQELTKVSIKGKGPARAFSEIAREFDTLGRGAPRE